MPPGLVPVLARGIDDAAVGFEELVGNLEDREHQPALRTPGDVAAALFAPDKFAGLALDAPGRAFLVDQAALEDMGLFDVDVLVGRAQTASARSSGPLSGRTTASWP